MPPRTSGTLVYKLGQSLGEFTDRLLGVWLYALASGLVAAMVELWLHYQIWDIKPGESRAAVQECVILGVFIGIVAWVEGAAIRERRLHVRHEMQRVAELNHRVRNALQTIQYGVRLPQNQDQIRMVDDSIRRIEETLKALYPMIGTAVTHEHASGLPPV